MTTLTTLAVQTIEATIKAMPTKDMVILWNHNHVDKPIKKFADRATAEKRCTALMIELAEKAAVSEPVAAPEVEKGAVHKARRSEEQSSGPVENDENQTEEEALAEIREAAAKAAAKKTSVGKSSGLTLSAAIAMTWQNPEVADRRKTRHAVMVTVNGKSGDFKSVRAAFAALGLPDEKHIRFRLKLKEFGSAVFEYEGAAYNFALVELAE